MEKTIQKKQITMKFWKTTHAKLRMIYALTGKKMIRVVDELVSTELERIQKEAK